MHDKKEDRGRTIMGLEEEKTTTKKMMKELEHCLTHSSLFVLFLSFGSYFRSPYFISNQGTRRLSEVRVTLHNASPQKSNALK